MKVTKELAKEIKQAKTILIYRDKNGIGQMSLLFEDEIRGKKVDTRKEYLTDTELKIYGGWRNNDAKPINHKAYCVAYLNYLDSTGPARSAFQAIKAGDEIKFHFIGRNNNELVENADLDVDEIRLEIRHMDKDVVTGKGRDWYTLDVTVSSHWSSARMVDEVGESRLSNIDLSQDRYKFENHADYPALFNKETTDKAVREQLNTTANCSTKQKA